MVLQSIASWKLGSRGVHVETEHLAPLCPCPWLQGHDICAGDYILLMFALQCVPEPCDGVPAFALTASLSWLDVMCTEVIASIGQQLI